VFLLAALFGATSIGCVLMVSANAIDNRAAVGGWIAQWIGYEASFMLLGAFGLVSIALWLAFGSILKKY
jgi:hypothetical protein